MRPANNPTASADTCHAGRLLGVSFPRGTQPPASQPPREHGQNRLRGSGPRSPKVGHETADAAATRQGFGAGIPAPRPKPFTTTALRISGTGAQRIFPPAPQNRQHHNRRANTGRTACADLRRIRRQARALRALASRPTTRRYGTRRRAPRPQGTPPCLSFQAG